MNQTFSNGSDVLSEQYDNIIKKKECKDSKIVNVFSKLEELKKEVAEGKRKEQEGKEREKQKNKCRGY